VNADVNFKKLIFTELGQWMNFGLFKPGFEQPQCFTIFFTTKVAFFNFVLVCHSLIAIEASPKFILRLSGSILTTN
jgi:hypothetical protein